MKSLIFPAVALILAVTAFVFWPSPTDPECIAKGKTTAIPWLVCK